MATTAEKPAMRAASVAVDDVSFRRALRAVGLALAVQADGFLGYDEFGDRFITITVDGTVYQDGSIIAQLLSAEGWNGSMVVRYGTSSNTDDPDEWSYYLLTIDLGVDDQQQYAPRQEVTETQVDEGHCINLKFLQHFL